MLASFRITHLLGLVLFAVMFCVTSPSAHALGGSFVAEGSTQTAGQYNADPDIDGAGALTITSVSLNGVVLTAGVHYNVINQGSSTAYVALTDAIPTGQTVRISGTTSNSGRHDGGIKFT